MFVHKLQSVSFTVRATRRPQRQLSYCATPKVPSFVLRVGPMGQAAALLAWRTPAASRSEPAPGTVRAAPDWPGSSAGCFLAPVESFSQSVL